MFHASRFMFYVFEMNTFLLGEKLGMTEWWNEKKEVEPITLVDFGRTVFVGEKTQQKDGYSSYILGILKKKSQTIESKSDLVKKSTNFLVIKEFRLSEEEKMEGKEGENINADNFKNGDNVKVIAITKGKGTQGVVRRHGFKGGPKSHGHRHVLRSAGSIGSAFPEHVQKGKKMAGSMGYEQVTIKNSKIAWIDKEKNIIAIKGAVPGRKGSWVKVVGM